MDELFADEADLREMLEMALTDEPSLGLVVRGAVRAGVRRRRRRRVTVYVASLGVPYGWVTPISTATSTARRPIRVPGTPFALVITPDGKTAFVLNERSQLTAFATGTGRTGKPIAIPPAPASGALAATPVITRDGRIIYLVSPVPGTVTPMVAASGRTGTPIRVGSRPATIAITPDGKTAYVTNGGSDTVTPIDTRTQTARAAIRVGGEPVAMVIAP